jgi:hypothetical protein
LSKKLGPAILRFSESTRNKTRLCQYQGTLTEGEGLLQSISSLGELVLEKNVNNVFNVKSFRFKIVGTRSSSVPSLSLLQGFPAGTFKKFSSAVDVVSRKGLDHKENELPLIRMADVNKALKVFKLNLKREERKLLLL